MSQLCRIAVALAVLCALAAMPALAAEAERDGDPIGNLMTPHAAEIVVGIAVFLVLVLVLSKTAWKPILDGLQRREETIRKAVDDAQAASAQARAVMAEYEDKLSHARDEAQAIAEEARKDAETVRRRIEEEGRATAEASIARAVKEIERAKDKAYHELLNEITVLAAEGASRILRRELRPEDNTSLISDLVESFAREQRRGAS
jgi:F-type H+-transporting ATPase subunit b